jgi:hypothetical protein
MIIDGKDILSAWGIALLDGSYGSFLKYPKRKSVEYSDYAEQDGIIPDLRKVELEAKSISLNFVMKHSTMSEFWERYQAFFTDMTATGYRTIVPDYGLAYTVRYDNSAKYESPRLFNEGPGLTSFTLSFVEDIHSIPLIEYPTGGINLRGLYEINGIDFGLFGIHPDGETGNMLKYPGSKPPFTNGQVYDLGTRRLKHKEITIPLWIAADSKEEFIHNYAAFFRQWNKPGKQALYSRELGGVTYAYYTDCPSYTVNWGNRVRAKFGISVVMPVVTWLNAGDTQVITVLEEIDSGLLANEQNNIITFNR